MDTSVLGFKVAYKLLSESSIGKEKELSLDNPFFLFSDEDSGIDHTMMLGSLVKEDICFLESINIPLILRSVYQVLGSSKREFKYKDYTFFSLDGIKKACELYEDGGQYKFCDIGMQYYGLGHVKVLTLCRETGLLFIRIDGGSNGYDRDTNYHNFMNLEKMDENVFTMEDFINNRVGEIFVYLG